MRRGHTIESYYKKIDQIRNSPRKISITTDIIVGFPGETKDDFSETVELAEYCKFDSAYIFKYSPRPGTPSFESGDSISEKEKTDRFLELENIQKRNQFNSLRQQLNLTHKVLAENKSSRSAKSLNGHTTCHKIVNFEADENLLGKILDIKITECKTNSLFGRIA